MGAITGIWNSEKGLIGFLLVIAATVLAALSVFTPEQWEGYTKWIFGIYVSGKTVQGAISTIFAKPEPLTPEDLLRASLEQEPRAKEVTP